MLEASVHQRKKLVLILLKQILNIPWVYIIMLIIVICLLIEKKQLNWKLTISNKNVNFSTWFCLGSISDGFSTTESREIFLNGSVYDFSVDYNYIDKSHILNIHKYLMTKNNIR